jgi:hypothetical protein
MDPEVDSFAEMFKRLKKNLLSTEAALLIVIAGVGLLPRLILTSVLPTIPISDFRSIINFAILLQDDILSPGARYWQLFSPALPLMLSGLFRVTNAAPEDVARFATAVLTGLAPLIPFVIWRGVFSLRVRLVSSLLLALWPGQIIFSGVVAQDNWVIPPAVALGALSVRSITSNSHPSPILGAILYALAALIREEMLFALVPLAIAVVIGRGVANWRRNVVKAGLIAFLIISSGVIYRGLATGRFSLTTYHSAQSILGAYAPGAGRDYWVDPKPFIAAVEPRLLFEEEDKLSRGMVELAWKELVRRPKFHAIRMVAAGFNGLYRTGTGNLYWSLTAPGVLSTAYREQADRLITSLGPMLTYYPVVLHGLFAAAVLLVVLVGGEERWAVLPLLGTVIIKLGLHSVSVAQPRFFVVVLAIEMLAVAILLGRLIRFRSGTIVGVCVATGLLASVGVLRLQTEAEEYIMRNEENDQRSYTFPLSTTGGASELICQMDQGRLSTIWQNGATIELLKPDPDPGDQARVSCQTQGGRSFEGLSLFVQDSYPHGGLPGRIVQRIFVGDTEVTEWDIGAQAWIGWHEIRLSDNGREKAGTMTIEILAVNPDRGAKWGPASSTMFTFEQSDD